jgi:hypothetical protein
VPAALSRVRPDDRAAARTAPAAPAAPERCHRGGGQASVPGVGGTDALQAARLAAGDDHALAEIYDRLAPSVYGAALRVLGEGAAAQDVV